MYRVYQFKHGMPSLFCESEDRKKTLATIDALVNDLEERCAVTFQTGNVISLMYMEKGEMK